MKRIEDNKVDLDKLLEDVQVSEKIINNFLVEFEKEESKIKEEDLDPLSNLDIIATKISSQKTLFEQRYGKFMQKMDDLTKCSTSGKGI